MDDFLLQVKKPGQYIGGEWNISRKDFDKAKVRFALCFPDLYEVGMSNLGIRIIYSALNALPGVAAERFFACGVDYGEALRHRGLEPVSLESGRRMGEFDIVGFSLGYELSYTNVLRMLSSSGIPLKSGGRGSSHPLVIAGGPCVANPEPMHEFFDAFLIGEAEEALAEIVDLVAGAQEKLRSCRMNRRDLLIALSQIEGVYVPSLYEVSYTPEGGIEGFRASAAEAPARVKKRFVKDLDALPFPVDWLVPYVQVIHDRITLELMRGCPNRCRFCQARAHYYPFRQRSAKHVLEAACETYKRTGYEEIALGGLSVSDYPHLEEVLRSLISEYKEKAVAISLPSIKPKLMLERLSGLIATIKKTGLTFAPEAASEKLRAVIGKEFDEKEFFGVVEKAYAAGYQHVKLYFMTGLPFEEMVDLDRIAGFAQQVSALRRKTGGSCAQVNVSVNTLLPKPHTPLQWLPMQDLATTQMKQEYLKARIKSRKIKVNFHNSRMSFLEGVLSRGDRRLSRVIENAFLKGAQFDSWEEHFSFEKWEGAFNECGISPDFYLRERGLDELLPWDFLDMGVRKEYLKEEALAVRKGL